MSLFVTFEGPEGCGKTTQIHLLRAWLEEKGRPVYQTREPGGTPIGDRLREVLHDPANTEMQATTEILLYSASRAQLVAEAIRPALARGQIVLCDRYAESTLAYQGYGRQLDRQVLHTITLFATGGLRPDLIVYLDISVEEGLRRKRRAHERENAEWNRMDQQTVDFYRRVRRGYLHLAEEEPDRWLILDASQSVEAIQQAIRQVVLSRLSVPTRA